MTIVVDALYLFSTVLLIPVVAGLFLLSIHALLELGGMFREWRERRAIDKRWQALQRQVATGRIPLEDLDAHLHDCPGLVGVFVERTSADGWLPAFVEKHAHNLEIESSAGLAKLSLLIRVGPILGLMGTLIPMGPALIKLSAADLAGMASDLIVAFSTTVLGLLIGGIAYAVWLARRQWYAQDLADIEFLSHVSTSDESTSPLVGSEPGGM